MLVKTLKSEAVYEFAFDVVVCAFGKLCASSLLVVKSNFVWKKIVNLVSTRRNSPRDASHLTRIIGLTTLLWWSRALTGS